MSKLKPFGGRVVRRTFFVGGFFPGTFATHFQLFNCKACDQYRNWLYLYLSSTKYCGVYIILICAIFRSTDGTLSLHRKRRKMFASTGRCKTDDFTIFRRSKRPKNKQFEKLDAPSSRHCARPINAVSSQPPSIKRTPNTTTPTTTNDQRTNDQRPTTNDQRHNDDDDDQRTNDQRPTTNDQRPTTNDQRPTTNDTTTTTTTTTTFLL